MCGSVTKYLCWYLIAVPNNEAVVKELSHLLDKVDEMKKQRQMLHTHLRDALQKDDVTRQIVTRNKGEELQVHTLALVVARAVPVAATLILWLCAGVLRGRAEKA